MFCLSISGWLNESSLKIIELQQQQCLSLLLSFLMIFWGACKAIFQNLKEDEEIKKSIPVFVPVSRPDINNCPATSEHDWQPSSCWKLKSGMKAFVHLPSAFKFILHHASKLLDHKFLKKKKKNLRGALSVRELCTPPSPSFSSPSTVTGINQSIQAAEWSSADTLNLTAQTGANHTDKTPRHPLYPTMLVSSPQTSRSQGSRWAGVGAEDCRNKRTDSTAWQASLSALLWAACSCELSYTQMRFVESVG